MNNIVLGENVTFIGKEEQTKGKYTRPDQIQTKERPPHLAVYLS